MSLLENFRKAGPKPILPLQASEVERKLNEARAALAALEAQRGAAALDALDGGAEAKAALEVLNRKFAAAQETVSTLSAAHKTAIERDEATIRAQRASLRKTQIAKVKSRLEAHKGAAVALAAAVAKAGASYRLLLETAEEARSACPTGMQWPDSSFGVDQIKSAVVHELYRASAIPGNRDRRAFPGAAPSGADTEWNPGAITPLADLIARHADGVIAQLTGKSAD